MARRVLVKVTSPSDTEGPLTAVIEAGSVRRMDETESDSPTTPETSSPVIIDTRQEIEASWDVPDSLITRAGIQQVGIQFNQDVRLVDGFGLEENPLDWLSTQGVELPFDDVAIIPLADDDETFALRAANLPTESVALDTEFTFIVRTTFNTKLSSAPSMTAISVSPATVVSVCQIVCNQSYGFTCRTPTTGSGEIDIVAQAAGWSVITANRTLATIEYGR